jgi:hypothetical protein
MIKIVRNNEGLFELWSDKKLLLKSDNLKGIVLETDEVNTLLGRGQISIKNKNRIDSIKEWIMFL